MASTKGVGRAKVRDMSEDMPRRRFPWLLLVAVVLLIGGIAYSLSKVAPMRQETAELPASTVQYSQTALEEAVHAKIYAKQYDEAVLLIRGQGEAEEPRVKVLLASVYAAKGDAPAALGVYDELEKQGKLDGGKTADAAEMAVRAERYEQARQYFEKAIKRTQQADEPQAADDVSLYRARLAEIRSK